MTHTRTSLLDRRQTVWVGNTVRAEASFANAFGVPPPMADQVTFTIKKPDGTTFVGALQNGSTVGTFYTDFLADTPGDWYVRAACTGVVPAAEEDRFTVKRSTVAGG